jgi:site-specific DNA-methyltransferase (adenine-specific)
MVKTDLHLGESLETMAALPAQSIDMVLCDLPYGVTAHEWDAVIPFPDLWAAYERLVKPRGAIVLTCSGLFAHALAMSKPDWYRYAWIWDKVQPVGFQIAKYRPMQRHEMVLVFGQESPNYYPVVTKNDEPQFSGKKTPSKVSPLAHDDGARREYFYKHPQSILTGETDVVRASKGGDRLLHPSQKPVPLMAWFIQNYSRPGDTVMDNTMGSGSIGVAAVIEGRNFVGIEQDFEYFTLASERIEEARAKEGVGHNFGTDSTGVLISRVVPEFTDQPGMDF